MGLVSRFIGIITSPKATFENVVAHPRWLGMMLLVALGIGLLVGGFLLTKVGQDAWLDMVAQGRFGRPMPPEQLATMERIAPYAGYIAAVQMLIFIPIMYVVVAGILYVLFTVAMGGTSTFKQVLAIVTHTGAIGILQQLFTVPMNFAQQSMTSKTNLAVFLPAMEGSFLGALLGTIDIFLIWQFIVLAIGLGVLYRRRTQPIAMTLFGIYGVIALIIATVMSRFGGSN
jgi:membrane protein, antimicrobial resistance system